MRVGSTCAIVVMLAAAAARADEGDSAKADALFRQGREAAEAGDYAAACPKFEESYRIEPAPGTLLNLADCEENRGQLARAWQHFRKLYEELPPSDERKALADARARSIEQRAPKLRVAPASSEPAVFEPVGDAKPVVVVHRDALPPPSNGRRTTALVLGGVGIGAVVTGAIFGVSALVQLSSANASCTGNVCANRDAVNQYDRARAFAIVTDVAIGVGVALIGSAIVVALTAPRSRGQATAYTWGQF